MSSEREQMSYLTEKKYEISGNFLRAFYDDADNLIFVVDSTITDEKPNVLLILKPVGDRKWDDILSNDYNVDLEDVRPKKDNKYQKLDIEYDGLDVYENLIQDYEENHDLENSLQALAVIRDISVRRSAEERLKVAESNAVKSRDTILRTNDSISEMEEKLKQLRAKLSQQKKQIGKEPTKQSASKILKTEAQIDAINEKLKRAKKRLLNAQKRLLTADEDAEIARGVLSREPLDVKALELMREKKGVSNLPARQKPNDLIVKQVAPVPAKQNLDLEEEMNNEENKQPKAEDMADEDVKPLLDEDPEILDEEIAFKPIDFGTVNSSDTTVKRNGTGMGTISDDTDEIDESESHEKEPLSFVPPVSRKTDTPEPIDVRPVAEDELEQTTPVLDTINSVEEPNLYEQQEEPKPMSMDNSAEVGQRPAPVMPSLSNASVDALNANNVDGGATVQANIEPAPVSSGVRPVSPITGNVAPVTQVQRKPTALYLVMLILLIALSIFTLWFYQKNISTDNVPDLTAPVQSAEEINKSDDIVKETESMIEGGVAESVSLAEELKEEPVQIITPTVIQEELEPVIVEEEIEPEPVPVTAPVEAVVVMPEPEPVSVSVTEEVVLNPFIQPITAQPSAVIEEESVRVIPTEEEIIASKPAYNVSQNEKMFVASPDYETDTPYYEEEQQQYYEEEPYYQEDVTSYVSDDVLCPDNSIPDMNGCCTGEVYTDMGELGFNCCPVSGGDCFPPLF